MDIRLHTPPVCTFTTVELNRCLSPVVPVPGFTIPWDGCNNTTYWSGSNPPALPRSAFAPHRGLLRTQPLPRYALGDIPMACPKAREKLWMLKKPVSSDTSDTVMSV
jgi:hypothetical protein